MTQAAPRVSDLVRKLLDKGYTQATDAVLRSMASSVTSGLVAQRLTELEAEAGRLAALGETLQPDNPVVRALTADLDTELRRNALRLDAGAGAAQQAGMDAAATLTRALALPGISDKDLARIGVRWRVPDPNAVRALVNYTSSPAWAAQIAKYPGLILQTVQNQAVRGLIEGWNPVTTARAIRQVAQGLTVSQGNTLLRTLQLTSYRDATAIHSSANADILTGQVRLATLDDRCCAACVALSGTRLAVGERIDGHWNCRCVAIQEVRGRPRDVPTGEDWFNSRTEAQQRAIVGDSGFELLQSGRATLRDFVHTHTDPIFGQQVSAASVKNVLARGNP